MRVRLTFGCGLAVLAAMFLRLADASAGSASGTNAFGPYGPEGPRLREQLWLLPSGDGISPLRATVFRPLDEAASGATRRPLAVINHGTSDATRLAVSMPVYYWLSRWFVERGYVVVLPQRRGHGATGGPIVDSIGSCTDPDHARSGLATADDIEAVVSYMGMQDFVQPGATVVVGISTGGWASLALASRNPPEVRAIVNFAGGRGGHAGGRNNAVCGEQRLIEAARGYGSTARIPTIWLYSRNDSYFGPKLASSMADAWQRAGELADFELLPPYGGDGHEIADDRAGWDIWGPAVDHFLASTAGAAIAAAQLNPPEDGAPPPMRASFTAAEGKAAGDQ